MSVRLMAAVWQLDLPSHLKLVLLAVADHANDDGWAYPGQNGLAAKCSLSERQVRSSLSELEALGVLQKHRRGKQRTNLYRVVPGGAAAHPVEDPVDFTEPPPGDRQQAAGGDRKSTAGVTGSPPPVHRNHQRTISGTASSDGVRWAREWARVRGVPATEQLLGWWATQVDGFIAAGGTPSGQLLEVALVRGIEQPAGWAFVVPGVKPPWPAWVPQHLLDAATHPDRPVDGRWEREYSYGPHSTPPADKAAVIRAKAALLRLAAAGHTVTEREVTEELRAATQAVTA